jgi:hypothetical protein
MEPASWLDNYADAKTRALLKPIDFARASNLAKDALKGKFDAKHLGRSRD